VLSFGASAAGVIMAATKSKIKEDICKWCKRAFETTPNPLVANPGAGDLLKRRCANGRDCRPCFVFIKNHDVYKEYTTSGLVDFLGEGSNQDDYNAALEEYCKGVRDGKKRTRSRGAVELQHFRFGTLVADSWQEFVNLILINLCIIL
jgi:hypothetical protein